MGRLRCVPVIIFGSYVIHHTVGEGHFHCPQCLGQTAYRLRRGRWWLHILFIPLIPMKRAQPFVQCGTCRSRFALGVLGPTELERYRQALGDQFPAHLVGLSTAQLPNEDEPAVGPGVPGLPGMPGVPQAEQVATDPYPVAGTPAAHAVDRYAALGGEWLAVARGVGAEVLRRSSRVTDQGAWRVTRHAWRVGVRDYTEDHVRFDVERLDTSYLPVLVRELVADARLGPAGGRGLVADAVEIAQDNGGLEDAQWEWIVRLGLEAGVGPTAAGEVRDGVLARS